MQPKADFDLLWRRRIRGEALVELPRENLRLAGIKAPCHGRASDRRRLHE
jgi:hypothetical protein